MTDDERFAQWERRIWERRCAARAWAGVSVEEYWAETGEEPPYGWGMQSLWGDADCAEQGDGGAD